jgi:hypothetical protein
MRDAGMEEGRNEKVRGWFCCFASFVQEQWHWTVLEGDVTLGCRVFIMEHVGRHMKG